MAKGFSGERQFTWRALVICMLISVSVLGFGYPTAIIGTTLSQPSFLVYMHLVDADGEFVPNAQSWIGTLSGVYQVLVLHIILYQRLTRLGWRCRRHYHWDLGHG
jgi:hypothetical protein